MLVTREARTVGKRRLRTDGMTVSLADSDHVALMRSDIVHDSSFLSLPDCSTVACDRRLISTTGNRSTNAALNCETLSGRFRSACPAVTSSEQIAGISLKSGDDQQPSTSRHLPPRTRDRTPPRVPHPPRRRRGDRQARCARGGGAAARRRRSVGRVRRVGRVGRVDDELQPE